MWQIDESESCAYLTERLEIEWNESAQKYIQENRIHYENYKKKVAQKLENSPDCEIVTI